MFSYGNNKLLYRPTSCVPWQYLTTFHISDNLAY